eukprot:8921579-Karenia_brevis.AAC.1
MVAGTCVALIAPVDDLAKPEVTGMQIAHTNQKPRGGRGVGSSKKAIWWLTTDRGRFNWKI